MADTPSDLIARLERLLERATHSARQNHAGRVLILSQQILELAQRLAALERKIDPALTKLPKLRKRPRL
jgi:hypothetical protein